MNILQQAARRLERLEALDKVAKPLARTVGRAVRPTVVRNLLTGTDLGHPLHPVLTDLPIGAWMMSALLDAADLLVAAGVAAALATAAAGLNDWSDTVGPQTRVGLVHAALNTTALSLYLASLVARARGRRRAGKALGLAGLGVLTGGAYLGGHLSFGMGVDVNRTAWQQRPDQWTPVLADTELADGTLRKVDAGGVPVLLHRDRGNGVRPGQHVQSHGRPAGGGHDQRRLRHLPVARQHLPVRRWQHHARPGQHARALLPHAHPERAYRGPRFHIGVADLSHRRGSSQKTPFCAPRTGPTEEAVPLQNEHLFVSRSRGQR
jgi:hypothetical protein